jgi:tetratricopeptide (TPR) repeat protein
MSSQADQKIAMALLQEVGDKVRQTLGNVMCRPPQEPSAEGAQRDAFCGDMMKQCELAEKKAASDGAVLLRSLILKAQLYGNLGGILGPRGNHKKAIACYDQALQLVADPAEEASIRYLFALMCSGAVSGVGGGRQKAIENLERAVQLVGIDSELGIESAKELERVRAEKGGACFIATAAYGTDQHHNVLVLSEFRDRFLLRNRFGRLFVKVYYFISPPLAVLVGKHFTLAWFTRIALLGPTSRVIRCFIYKRSDK